MSSGVPPARSTAFHGSVSSTCSTPSAARNAIFIPCSSFAMTASSGDVLSISTYPGSCGTNGTKHRNRPGPGPLPAAAGLDVAAGGALVVRVLGLHRMLAHRARGAPRLGDGDARSGFGRVVAGVDRGLAHAVRS